MGEKKATFIKWSKWLDTQPKCLAIFELIYDQNNSSLNVFRCWFPFRFVFVLLLLCGLSMGNLIMIIRIIRTLSISFSDLI